jgi:hypothetical protein
MVPWPNFPRGAMGFLLDKYEKCEHYENKLCFGIPHPNQYIIIAYTHRAAITI